MVKRRGKDQRQHWWMAATCSEMIQVQRHLVLKLFFTEIIYEYIEKRERKWNWDFLWRKPMSIVFDRETFVHCDNVYPFTKYIKKVAWQNEPIIE